MLKWLRSVECDWERHTCNSAAKGGHLEVLKFLREQGCAWDLDTAIAAAEGDTLRC